MSQRNVTVVHVLPTRQSLGTREFLLFPHARWHSPAARPFLALPSKQVRGLGLAAIEDALGTLLHDELGLASPPAPLPAVLPSLSLGLRSPGRGVHTTYHVLPAVVSVAPAEQAALRQRVGGEWVPVEEALSLPLLSPTARRALERAAPEAFAALPAAQAQVVQMLAAQAGDLELFARLFDQLRPRLIERLRRCRRTTALFREPQDVEDALANAAAQILTHLTSFDPARGAAEAWLWVIVHNCAINLLRRRGRDHALPLVPEGEETVPGPNLDPARLAADHDDLAHLRGRIEEVLAQVRPEARAVWQLWTERGLSYKEIAAEVGIPTTTIGGLLYQVRTKVRALLAQRPAGLSR